MKKLIILSLILLCALPLFAQEKALSKEEANIVRDSIYSQWAKAESARLGPVLTQGLIVVGNDTMRLAGSYFGTEPQDGRSLWISMHGGGSAPKAVNDGQWVNQTRLYQPKEGYYICPRAPWNAWNMWFQEPIDSMYNELIRALVVCGHLNPNKVYIMGYSAGGDGIWRLAPRMADHWAAAAMMAGHPGDVSLVNVRNMPFCIWVGGDDFACDRNKRAVERAKELDSLQQADQEGYLHESHILPGLPHWMNHQDTAAVAWMAQYVRNPHPKKVIWRQEEVVRPYFYWIGVPRQEMQRGKTVIARIGANNKIFIDQCDYSHLTLYLDDDMVNLDKPIKVYLGKKCVLNRVLPRLPSHLRSTLNERGDINYCFPAIVEIAL